MTFETIGTSTVGEGVFLRLEVVRLRSPDGQEVQRDVLRHPGGVGILPVDGDEVILLRQFRVAAGEELLEIPAGKLDRTGEEIADGASRELEEEIGFRPRELVPIGRMLPSPGYTDEVIHLYVADGIVPVPDRRPDGVEEHHAEVVRVGFEEAVAMVGEGLITDAKTQIALLRWSGRRRQP